MNQTDFINIDNFEEIIEYRFKKRLLLEEALTHSSYIKKSEKELKNNQRMEFLGDSVLELIVNDFIYKKFSGFSEGEMTKIKSVIVSTETLKKWANSIDIGRFMLLGKGENLTGGRNKPSILAGCFEALLGAIYLDGGLKNARKFIFHFLQDEIRKVVKNGFIRNYKSFLQELSQKDYKCLPIYELIRENGPDHKKIFCVNVKIKEKKYGTGFGENKKEAEQEAAKATLKKLKMIE